MAAYSSSKMTLAKQLKEYLEEQQEPFSLSTYLSERRHRAKSLSSIDGRIGNLEETYVCGLAIIEASKRALKLFISRLATLKHREETSNCGSKSVEDEIILETIDMIKQIADTNWFSTLGNANALHSPLPDCRHHNG